MNDTDLGAADSDHGASRTRPGIIPAALAAAVAGRSRSPSRGCSCTRLLRAGFFGGDTGDEPPIRVKGGSVDFYLASKKEEPMLTRRIAKKFTMGGERAKDPLDVVIAVTAAAAGSCTAQTGTGDLVTIEYLKSDGNVVTITIGTDLDPPKKKHSAVAFDRGVDAFVD